MRRAGIAVGLVAVVAAAYLLGRAGRVVEPRSRSEAAAPAPQGAATDRALVDAVRSLNDRVARLERQGHGAAPAAPGAPGDPDEDEPDDPEAVHERERAIAVQQATSLETELRAEPVDRQWAAQAEQAIRQPIEAGLVPGVTIERVQCASRICRVDLATAGDAEGVRMMRDLPLRTPFLPSAHIERTSDERAVVYFGRTREEIGRVVAPPAAP